MSQLSTLESVVIQGDLSTLSPDDRARYYQEVCKSLALNPLTRPFEYIVLNGKLTLYARKDCTDQLRRVHHISIVDIREEERNGLYIVTVKAQDAEGRTDMAKGAVNLNGLKGPDLANQIMKAETKAKRRVTLSICGLGLLDETEIDTVAQHRPRESKPDNRTITSDQWKLIKQACWRSGCSTIKLLANYRVDKPSQLPALHFEDALAKANQPANEMLTNPKQLEGAAT